MSRSCSSTLFVGVRLTEVYTERQATATVQKFDPDTGVPVSQTVPVLQRTLFGRLLPELRRSRRNPYGTHKDADFERDFESLPLPDGLTACGDDDHPKDWLIGRQVGVATDDYDRPVVGTTLVELIAAAAAVEAALVAAGCTAKPQVFNCLHCG